MKKLTLTLSLTLFICFINFGQKLPFQGFLEESGVPVDGTRNFIFELTDYGWTETINNVSIDRGIYNVVLGDITPLPDSLFVGTSESPLTITINGTEVGQVMLYKPLINGASLTTNGESIKIKSSAGNLRGELFPSGPQGQLRLYGANDSLKLVANGAYGGRLSLLDSLGSIGAQLRVTNKGRGNLYTYNENNQNVGWFGGTGNDGFAQIVAYDATETVSGALLLGSFIDGIYPEVYLEGTAQENFGLTRLKVSQLGNSTEETARLEINRSNGGGQAILTINQDDAGSDPAGAAAGLELFGDASPNILLGSLSFEDHDLANMSLYGAIPDGSGWFFSAANFNVSKTPGGQEYGFLSLNNNIVGTSTETAILTGNLFDSGAGGIELKDSLGTQTILLDGQTGEVTAVNVSPSDKRLKKDINTLDNALSNTLSLRGTSYFWKDNNKPQRKQVGVIAQELEEVYPELVHTNDKGYKSVNYSQLTAVLIEAIKTLNAKVESLESENIELTAALDETKELSERISRLENLLLKEAKAASK